MTDETDNVIIGDFVTSGPIPVDRVLGSVPDLDSVVVIGFNQDGSEYFASSEPNGAEVLWMLERAKKKLLEIADE